MLHCTRFQSFVCIVFCLFCFLCLFILVCNNSHLSSALSEAVTSSIQSLNFVHSDSAFGSSWEGATEYQDIEICLTRNLQWTKTIWEALKNKNRDLNNIGFTFFLCVTIYLFPSRSWHDEAYLCITQAITQEKPNINRPDMALMMYQRGLGLLDLALCVDTEVSAIRFRMRII